MLGGVDNTVPSGVRVSAVKFGVEETAAELQVSESFGIG